MTHPVRLALGLWVLLAIVVFNVRFDWEARVAAYTFVQSQLARQARGVPLPTINDGFRPMVRSSARHAAVWLVVIAGAGAAATVIASRTDMAKRMRAVPSERTQVR